MSEILKETRNFVKDLSKNASERIKLPIVFVYIIVFIGFHWNFLFILLFQKGDVILKVNYLKTHLLTSPFKDFGITILISIFATLIFPIIQVGINYAFQWFKYKEIGRSHDEDLKRAKNERDVLDIRTGNQERQGLQNQIDTLTNEKQILLDQVGSLNSELSGLTQKDIELNKELTAKGKQINDLTVKNKALASKEGNGNSALLEIEFDSILDIFFKLIHFLKASLAQNINFDIKFFFERMLTNAGSFQLQTLSPNLSLDNLVLLKNKLLELGIIQQAGPDLYLLTSKGKIVLKQLNALTKGGMHIINQL